MKNMDFYVTPVLNVDGYMFSWQNNEVWPQTFLIYSSYFQECVTKNVITLRKNSFTE